MAKKISIDEIGYPNAIIDPESRRLPCCYQKVASITSNSSNLPQSNNHQNNADPQNNRHNYANHFKHYSGELISQSTDLPHLTTSEFPKKQRKFFNTYPTPNKIDRDKENILKLSDQLAAQKLQLTLFESSIKKRETKLLEYVNRLKQLRQCRKRQQDIISDYQKKVGQLDEQLCNEKQFTQFLSELMNLRSLGVLDYKDDYAIKKHIVKRIAGKSYCPENLQNDSIGLCSTGDATVGGHTSSVLTNTCQSISSVERLGVTRKNVSTKEKQYLDMLKKGESSIFAKSADRIKSADRSSIELQQMFEREIYDSCQAQMNKIFEMEHPIYGDFPEDHKSINSNLAAKTKFLDSQNNILNTHKIDDDCKDVSQINSHVTDTNANFQNKNSGQEKSTSKNEVGDNETIDTIVSTTADHQNIEVPRSDFLNVIDKKFESTTLTFNQELLSATHSNPGENPIAVSDDNVQKEVEILQTFQNDCNKNEYLDFKQNTNGSKDDIEDKSKRDLKQKEHKICENNKVVETTPDISNTMTEDVKDVYVKEQLHQEKQYTDTILQTYDSDGTGIQRKQNKTTNSLDDAQKSWNHTPPFKTQFNESNASLLCKSCLNKIASYSNHLQFLARDAMSQMPPNATEMLDTLQNESNISLIETNKTQNVISFKEEVTAHSKLLPNNIPEANNSSSSLIPNTLQLTLTFPKAESIMGSATKA